MFQKILRDLERDLGDYGCVQFRRAGCHLQAIDLDISHAICNISSMLLDTDVIIAALRSSTGASAEIVRRVLQRQIAIELSVAMALEYEAVATRDEHLAAGELTKVEALNVIDALVALANPVEINFRWRPQLRDADDEMVFEAAINAKDRRIVTFNIRDFARAAHKFDVALITPGQILEGLR